MFDIREHLSMRMGYSYYRRKNSIHIDSEKCSATFYLHNLSGQFIGYQRYNPLLKKNRSNLGKYFTHNPTGIGVYGLEYLNPSNKLLFVTEGIFNASVLSEYGNSIAVLGNNPTKIKEQLKLLSYTYDTVAICDYGDAGEELATYTRTSVIMPTEEDINDVYQKYGYIGVEEILTEFL